MAEAEARHLDMLLSAVRRLEPLIREQADEAERNRRLSQPVVTALAEAGIFRMYTPRTLGGFEVEPLTFYRIVEEIARIDASTAWCVWIASGNPVFAGSCLPDQGAEAVFGKDLKYEVVQSKAPTGASPLTIASYHAPTLTLTTDSGVTVTFNLSSMRYDK